MYRIEVLLLCQFKLLLLKYYIIYLFSSYLDINLSLILKLISFQNLNFCLTLLYSSSKLKILLIFIFHNSHKSKWQYLYINNLFSFSFLDNTLSLIYRYKFYSFKKCQDFLIYSITNINLTDRLSCVSLRCRNAVVGDSHVIERVFNNNSCTVAVPSIHAQPPSKSDL